VVDAPVNGRDINQVYKVSKESRLTMTEIAQLIKEQQKTNQLLETLVRKMSNSPITSGLVSLNEACEMLGWSYETGRKKLKYIRDNYPKKLTVPEGNPTKYNLDEILVIQAELRNGKIKMKYYNKAA
jgi:hypothetical protein